MSKDTSGVLWKFHRMGGLDQVTLRTSEELTRLRELNPKLWVALSCPSSGLEFDPRTLALLDRDADGRIRVPEVLGATEWLATRLANPADIVDAPNDLPLERITTATPEGERLLMTARSVLATLGKAEATSISHEDVVEALKNAENNLFNGDGVVSPNAEFTAEESAFIADALAVLGGVEDSSGAVGINADIANAFVETLTAWQKWRETVDHAAAPLGAETAEAWELMQSLGQKIEDYFLRCDLAAFAPWSRDEGAEENRPALQEHGLMNAGVLEELPLARIEPERALSFTRGVNPAWRARLERLGELLRPLLPAEGEMGRDDWCTIRKTFTPYEKAVSEKPAPATAAATIAPTSTPDKLGEERIAAILSSGVVTKVLDLIRQDAEAPAASTDIADLERLVLYHAHLHRLLMNFVSFYDFYSLRTKATFQYGTLYLDGRSCGLCLPVGDVAKHAKLATFSQLCLVYCTCSRKKAKPETGEDTMTIVAAMTAGNADMLIEGRNGVFYDSAGRDWDATVTKVVSNPISIRQAMWDPYRRFARMIGEQIAKFAASKQADVTKKLNETAVGTVAGKPAAPAFDIGKSVGIFAAIGLALGALGTAVASIANALFSLAWWQFPLIFVGGFILISGPSVVLAWLKLRKRSLGPLLEASGWAVNTMVPINFTLGRELTKTAQLPPNVNRSFNDPLHAPRRWPGYLFLVLLLAAGAAAWVWYTWPKLPFPLPWK